MNMIKEVLPNPLLKAGEELTSSSFRLVSKPSNNNLNVSQSGENHTQILSTDQFGALQTGTVPMGEDPACHSAKGREGRGSHRGQAVRKAQQRDEVLESSHLARNRTGVVLTGGANDGGKQQALTEDKKVRDEK